MIWCGEQRLSSISSLPDSIFERSRMSLINSSRCWPLLWIVSRYSWRSDSFCFVAATKHFGEAKNRVHRRADFVAHAGEEFALGPIGRFGGVLGIAELDVLLFELADVVKARQTRRDMTRRAPAPASN